MQGEDYKIADNRALKFSGRGQVWPDKVVVQSARLVVSSCSGCGDDASFDIPPARFNDAGYPVSLAVELSREQTVQLIEGLRRYRYRIEVTTTSGSNYTIASGLMTVGGKCISCVSGASSSAPTGGLDIIETHW